MTFTADRIRSLREGKGLTRAQLARATGVTYMTVKNWEDGEHSPWYRHEVSLERVFGLRERAVAVVPTETVLEIMNDAKTKIAAALGYDRERIKLTVTIADEGNES